MNNINDNIKNNINGSNIINNINDNIINNINNTIMNNLNCYNFKNIRVRPLARTTTYKSSKTLRTWIDVESLKMWIRKKQKLRVDDKVKKITPK